MESSQIVTSYGQCRCCLNKGNHLDLMNEYYCSGTCEVYSDILVDCFNIFICTDARLTTLICRPCVQQLRNALHFKTKILDSEEVLLKSLDSKNDKLTVYLNSNATEEVHDDIDIKEEVFDENVDLLPYEPEHNDEDEKFDFKEKDLLNRFPRDKLQLLPNRSKLHTICSHFCQELEKIKGKTITAKMIALSFEANGKTKTPQVSSITTNGTTGPSNISSEKMGHIANITTLLAHSNLTAFKTRFKNGFPCFYCTSRFEKLQELRTHQNEHKKENLMQFVKKKYRPGRPDCLVVYAEVTDLKCTLCNQNIPNIQELKVHLVNIHKKTLYLQYTDRVIPFKILDSGYQCQICNFFFETFGFIEKHMNTHFRNFVCDQCGAGFISKNRLKIHTYNLHSGVGDYPCELCKKSFHTRNKLKLHISLVHKMLKKLKCPKCPTRFNDYFVCQKHMVDVHGVSPIKYKCNVCDKAYSRRFHLSKHIKKEHLDEKDLFCQLCTFTCYSNGELKDHMAKQHRERLFECPMCCKCYSSQRSLKQHVNLHKQK